MDINENEILLIRAFKNGDQKAFEKLFERSQINILTNSRL